MRSMHASPERLRRELRQLADKAENLLHRMDSAAREGDGSGAGGYLRGKLERSGRPERGVEPRIRTAGQKVRGYFREHPWIIAGGIAALMLVAGALSRSRQ